MGVPLALMGKDGGEGKEDDDSLFKLAVLIAGFLIWLGLLAIAYLALTR